MVDQCFGRALQGTAAFSIPGGRRPDLARPTARSIGLPIGQDDGTMVILRGELGAFAQPWAWAA